MNENEIETQLKSNHDSKQNAPGGTPSHTVPVTITTPAFTYQFKPVGTRKRK